MNVLRPANKANAGHAEAVGVESFFRGSDQSRVIGQAEIIIRAHVKDAPTTRDANPRILRGRDNAFGFVKTLRSDLREGVGQPLIEFREHDPQISRWMIGRQS